MASEVSDIVKRNGKKEREQEQRTRNKGFLGNKGGKNKEQGILGTRKLEFGVWKLKLRIDLMLSKAHIFVFEHFPFHKKISSLPPQRIAMKLFIPLISILILLSLSQCKKTVTKSKSLPEKIYPEEKNFLQSMHIGDTVHFFIKESGYFNPDRNSNYKTHLTCYAKLEILRADTFLYLSRLYFSVPGGLGQLGPNLEFDSVTCNFEVITKKFDLMELFCHYESNYTAYAFGDSCLLREFDLTGYPREFVLKRWKHFCSLGMSDSVYNEWRFNPPTHEQLTQWRKSMFMNEPNIAKRYEVLSFFKDTCKISYSNELPITFPYDFSRLK